MVTHSSILAWENLWTKEPGRLQSMGIAKESGMTWQLNNNKTSYRHQNIVLDQRSRLQCVLVSRGAVTGGDIEALQRVPLPTSLRRQVLLRFPSLTLLSLPDFKTISEQPIVLFP